MSTFSKRGTDSKAVMVRTLTASVLMAACGFCLPIFQERDPFTNGAVCGAPAKALYGQVSSSGATPSHRADAYGGSFYSPEERRAILKGAGQTVPSMGTKQNLYGGSLYFDRSKPVPATNFGITTLGGPRLGGSNPLGGPAHITPNGIGAPSTRQLNFVTPLGNGANAPMGTYGGTSFGSSSGGAVR